MQTDVDPSVIHSDTGQMLFELPTPSLNLLVSVVVPVRNEAHHLEHTLDALRNQIDTDGTPLDPTTFEVLVLVNNCTDQSYLVAVGYQQRYPCFRLHVVQVQLPTHKANIGTVRRLLMDSACRRLMSVGKTTGIIASTDGDTIVDRYWLHYIQLEIANGNDAVGGRILTRPDGSQVRLLHLRDVLYRTLIARAEAVLDPAPNDPWPRHFQHFGASIAVTCRMYQQAGGLPEKPFLEDEAFYRALLRTDAKVRKSPHVKVFTSTRTQGRVAVGFSEQLRYWGRMRQSNQCQVAEPAEAVVIRLRNRHRLRQCWEQRMSDLALQTIIASELMIDADWLGQELKGNPFFGQLWEKVEDQMALGPWAAHWIPVPITAGIQALRTFLKIYPDYFF
ncbi:glycosyltransferase family A protein [Spirosoma rigui]|uniref:glycosyltransferase family A protein n=1 Tax=Spirosoma rigui TaxID=564064 RepID=UPI0009AF9D26|nr:glycosyltransferase family A protein [Spirosoma rigui]